MDAEGARREEEARAGLAKVAAGWDCNIPDEFKTPQMKHIVYFKIMNEMTDIDPNFP